MFFRHFRNLHTYVLSLGHYLNTKKKYIFIQFLVSSLPYKSGFTKDMILSGYVPLSFLIFFMNSLKLLMFTFINTSTFFMYECVHKNYSIHVLLF